jgi:hypothetical protein
MWEMEIWSWLLYSRLYGETNSESAVPIVLYSLFVVEIVGREKEIVNCGKGPIRAGSFLLADNALF